MGVWKRSVELSRYAVGEAMEIEFRAVSRNGGGWWERRQAARAAARGKVVLDAAGAEAERPKLARGQASALTPGRQAGLQAAARRASR